MHYQAVNRIRGGAFGGFDVSATGEQIAKHRIQCTRDAVRRTEPDVSLAPLDGWNIGLGNICGVGQVALRHASRLSGRTNTATKKNRHLVVATLLAPDRLLRRCRSSHAHCAPYQDSVPDRQFRCRSGARLSHTVKEPPSSGGTARSRLNPEP
jgi:hypothetical protein